MINVPDKPQIKWQKAHNPYKTIDAEDLEEHLQDPDEIANKDNPEEENDNFSRSPSHKNLAVVMTPEGVLPITEYTDIYQTFELWRGHTNFNISEAVSDIIENSPGVEILHILTRYRFLIGVGTLFQPRTVFNEINQQVKDYLAQRKSSITA